MVLLQDIKYEEQNQLQVNIQFWNLINFLYTNPCFYKNRENFVSLVKFYEYFIFNILHIMSIMYILMHKCINIHSIFITNIHLKQFQIVHCEPLQRGKSIQWRSSATLVLN